VVEGIETPQELDYVRALGVDMGQGYHFSRPVAPEVIAALLAGTGTITPSTGAQLAG
jgi:EAL domain-containing protein (putative c-di-GMP-specific phosphodiesterase class I)